MTTLIATTLARSRMTIGTLLVLALALGWDVQRAWCVTPTDVRLVELAHSEFANLTKAELTLLRFAGAHQAPSGAFAAAGPSSNPDDPSHYKRCHKRLGTDVGFMFVSYDVGAISPYCATCLAGLALKTSRFAADSNR